MNIEFASPADFMPLPAQWETRSQFIKRYSQKIGQPPYDRLLPNLSQQQFSLHYQAIRQLL
jgi:hypothetical protein